MYRSVVVHELSDDFSNISVETFERQDLQPDELRIKVKSASVNFPDLLMTAGLYQYKPEVPFTLGMESSGIVIGKGTGVENFEINDEVYSKLKLENDIVPLFYARSATQEEWNPVVWARKVSNGKVFFDALGHDAESFNHPKHSEIIIRAKNWITDREKDY